MQMKGRFVLDLSILDIESEIKASHSVYIKSEAFQLLLCSREYKHPLY